MHPVTLSLVHCLFSLAVSFSFFPKLPNQDRRRETGRRTAERLRAPRPLQRTQLAAETAETGDGKEHSLRERPEVIVKVAVDAAGSVDDLRQKPARFTSPESLREVHRLRRECDAVLVGSRTALRDDPSLTVRLVSLPEEEGEEAREREKLTAGWWPESFRSRPRTEQPIRVVLDSKGRLASSLAKGEKANLKLLCDEFRTVVFEVFADNRNTKEKQCQGSDRREGGVKVRHKENDKTKAFMEVESEPGNEEGPGCARVVSLSACLRVLRSSHDVQRVLVEGGPSVVRRWGGKGGVREKAHGLFCL
uniref:Bacterial bifunctional deaminase-reductase C-terminal domain-containing protein n=1 Tax=Chromera velia CCMP2878 TaxID=1169474 RepID=A0A0G4GEF4_9ALVE|eukprot:Cvel_21429.t1-p1 / transcript=Cvel_21429.t1 / gene=Cvel_21429 / organism=Chromera_velia_CCMP2878 / gene_product=2,5-diamino-6-ribosylamino-4(3H)-pyrimidinone, putative / transcript_product=2,5-diamino-6-ribosylamino-4(3H)-pyrimidinone, putative / location=Cvel_scaffold2009:1026-3243(-) / protein_length=305 / sequence_SO=supercontig / SO=protein_coding / is_pseudo=false